MAILTIVAWLIATLLTQPESDVVLSNFFRQIRPGGPGWKPIAKMEPDVKVDKDLGISIVGALFAAGIVYLMLPAVGYLIFGHTIAAVTCLVLAGVCAVVVGLIVKKIF